LKGLEHHQTLSHAGCLVLVATQGHRNHFQLLLHIERRTPQLVVGKLASSLPSKWSVSFCLTFLSPTRHLAVFFNPFHRWPSKIMRAGRVMMQHRRWHVGGP
jgi:hypothetical protein